MNQETKIADTGEVINTATVNSAPTDDTHISMSKSDYEKAVQSAEDKVRGKLYKQIKELETKLSALEEPKDGKPSEAEREIQERLVQIEAREKLISLKDALYDKNLDRSFADYLKDDTDIESFCSLINKVFAEKVKAQSYIPGTHQSNKGVSADDWNKMGYDEKIAFREKNPEMTEIFLKKNKL
ncbi:MAG: hypothetical protein FWG70_03975 [Oscillospiraceae bacterium]|nr:hypothetical protein [Oscillospiraceae bacterium]